MENGIYFNLPEQQYFDEKRLSSTDIRRILESPTSYWFNSNYNVLKKEQKSDFLESGKLFHAYILDRKNFENNYRVTPEEIDKLNKNSNEYKTWRVLQCKEVVPYKKFKEMELIVKYLEQPQQLLYNDVFKNGFPEVSIFWEYNGIPCKQRVDYLKLTQYLDLKTYIKNKNGNLDNYIAKYFYAYKVYIQMYFYGLGIKAAKQFTTEQVHGTPEQKRFFKDWCEQEIELPIVVFVNRELPQFRIKTFIKEDCPDLYRIAEKQTNQAISIFKKYSEEKGVFSAWLENIDTSNISFKDNDFPQSFYDILEGENYE